MRYNHTPAWTVDDGEAYRRYHKGVRGPREIEANSKYVYRLRKQSKAVSEIPIDNTNDHCTIPKGETNNHGY